MMLMFQFQFSIIIIIMDELKVWITGKKKQNKKKSSTFWQREKQWKYEWRTNESIIGYFFFYCLSNGCTWNGDILFHSLHYTSFTLLFFLVCFVFVATKKKTNNQWWMMMIMIHNQSWNNGDNNIDIIIKWFSHYNHLCVCILSLS